MQHFSLIGYNTITINAITNSTINTINATL